MLRDLPADSATPLARLLDVTGGEVLVAALSAHGVDVVFGIPGTHNLSVFDALRRYGVRTVATTHEQGAGYAADGYARTSGRPGVLVVTSGPAVYNAATAVAQAYSDSVPILLVSPGMPRSLPVGGPGSGYLHEAKDQNGAMDRIAAASMRPTTHQGIADAVADAFASFVTGRPRPIHVEVPLDLLEERGDADVVTHDVVAPTAADRGSVLEAADLLAAASRVVIVAGGGARGAADEVCRIAESLGAPVATTINGIGVLDGTHPLALGQRLWSAPVMRAVAEADVVLIVGSEVGQSDLFNGPLQPGGRVVRVDIDPQMADINVRTDVMLVGDAKLTLAALLDALDMLGARDSDPEVAAWAADVRSAADEAARDMGRNWLPWVAAIESSLDDDAVLATDNAMCVYYGLLPNLIVRHPSSVHFPTGFGTLGFTVPVAIGAALAAPGRQVVGVSGDGGLLFTVTELATAAAEQLPIAVIVFDNSGYGEIRNEMLDRGEVPVAVAAPPRDLLLVARGLGAHAVRVESPEGLAAEIASARRRPGPTVIVVPEPPREEEA